LEEQIPTLLEIVANTKHIVQFSPENHASTPEFHYTNNSVADFADQVRMMFYSIAMPQHICNHRLLL